MPTPTATVRHIGEVLASAEGERHSAVPDVVQSSWQRSASEYKIDPASDHSPQLLTEKEICGLRESIARLLQVAQGELDRLYKLVRPARYVILLCNRDGVVIDHRGEELEAKQFRYWGTWLGGVWAEDVEGTNGIGTCIAEERPVTVHRSQHFRARHINLSCSGAPIFGTDGQIAAVLDVSSIDPNLSEHAHALTGALTIATARAIEERIFREEFRRNWIFAIRLPTELGSAMLIAVDQDQHIVGANRAGRRALAQWGHQLGQRIGMTAVFERPDRLFQRKDFDDRWTLVQRRDTDEFWAAIVTSPEPSFGRQPHPDIEDLFLRPRLDMLLSDRWAPEEALVLRGGLAPATLRRVREHIDTHLNQNIDLESLAAIAGLSTFHFARAFKQSEGTTPHNYVLERRIAKARELLQQSDLSLSGIASALGFSDQSHFTRRFKEAAGVSPGQFRKRQQ